MRWVPLSWEEKKAQLDLEGVTVPLGPQLILPKALVILPVHHKEVLVTVERNVPCKGLNGHPNARPEVHELDVNATVCLQGIERRLFLD